MASLKIWQRITSTAVATYEGKTAWWIILAVLKCEWERCMDTWWGTFSGSAAGDCFVRWSDDVHFRVWMRSADREESVLIKSVRGNDCESNRRFSRFWQKTPFELVTSLK